MSQKKEPPQKGKNCVGSFTLFAFQEWNPLRLLALLALFVLSGTEAQAFTIYNNGTTAVENIYIEPPEYPNWGDDLLYGILYPNQTWSPRFGSFSECIQDIKIVWVTGNSWEWNRYNTCARDLYLNS